MVGSLAACSARAASGHDRRASDHCDEITNNFTALMLPVPKIERDAHMDSGRNCRAAVFRSGL